MKWLALLSLCLLASVFAIAVIDKLTPMPSLEGRTVSRALADTSDTPLGRMIAPAAEAHPGLSGIRALPASLDAFAARAFLARAATRSIDAQYYIWHDDLTGMLLFSELAEAAKRGVRVRLLLDDNNTAGLDAIIASLDAHPNVEVRLFNPFIIREPRLLGYLTDFSRLNRRMHNKSFTVDNQATIVGGRNVGNEYFGAGDDALFADLDVLAVGPIVPQMSEDFDRYWASGSSYPADRIVKKSAEPLKVVHYRTSRLTAAPKASSYLAALRNLPLLAQLQKGTLEVEWAATRMVSDSPDKGLGLAQRDELLFTKLRQTMGEPDQYLGLVSGYFVPTKEGTRAFVEMARSGVEVTILTNAFETTDVPIVHAGYAKWRKPLLEAGVRLFEMRGLTGAEPRLPAKGFGSGGSQPGRATEALHAKTIQIDGERVFVGSFNFDPRSANLNTELGFVIDSPALARRMHSSFKQFAPANTYEVRLAKDGRIYWAEREGENEIRHYTEPGTTRLKRAAVYLLSKLPIEWLL